MLGVVGGAGAVASSWGRLGGDAEPTVRDLLAGPLRLKVTPEKTAVRLGARLDRGDHFDEAKLALRTKRGRVELTARGDQVELVQLTLGFEPIELPAMPGDIRLVDVGVRLVRPARSVAAEWRPDDRGCSTTLTASLELRWSLEVVGQAYELAPKSLGDVSLALVLSGGGTTAGATFLAAVPGVTWSWADAVFLGDLTVAVSAIW